MLKGFSNFDIEIINSTTLKKSAKTDEEWRRLKKQCDKQMLFPRTDSIYAPVIYEIGKNYFTMKYEKDSKNFIEYLSNNNLNNDYFYIDILKDYFRRIINNSPKKDIYNVFIMKINNVIENCVDNDLSLSNILLQKKENSLIFIDFLDNFEDTIMQDIVKLRQDTHLHLILHMNDYQNDIIMMKLKEIDNIFDAFFGEYSFYNRYYIIFQVLNLLRIIPYTKDQKFIDLLLQKCDNLLK
jgi:hypothetical protein